MAELWRAFHAARGVAVPGTSLSAGDVLALLGAAVVGATLLRSVLRALGAAAALVTPRKRLTSYGSWAVVTGATDVRGRLCRESLAAARRPLCVSTRPPPARAAAAAVSTRPPPARAATATATAATTAPVCRASARRTPRRSPSAG